MHSRRRTTTPADPAGIWPVRCDACGWTGETAVSVGTESPSMPPALGRCPRCRRRELRSAVVDAYGPLISHVPAEEA